jgi:hypothetical protein
MEKYHVATWALTVMIVLFALKVVEGYVIRSAPSYTTMVPSNVQDTITGDKKYVYM